jgi:hypothetical protein
MPLHVPIALLMFRNVAAADVHDILKPALCPTSHAKLLVILTVGRATLKMLGRKSKTQFVKQERNTQNAIALLNYLKRIAPQQLMLRTQVFTQKF